MTTKEMFEVFVQGGSFAIIAGFSTWVMYWGPKYVDRYFEMEKNRAAADVMVVELHRKVVEAVADASKAVADKVIAHCAAEAEVGRAARDALVLRLLEHICLITGHPLMDRHAPPEGRDPVQPA